MDPRAQTTVTEHDVELADGRLHVYDTGDGDVPVLWHHGTPNIGSPPEPLFAAARGLGVRWVSWDRPGYGGSSPRPGRDVASAAALAAAVTDALGIQRFAVMGHSGGGPHALACAALLPERVTGVVAAAALAPYDAEGLDHAEGMTASGAATLRAAAAGRAVKEQHEHDHGDDYDPEFTASDGVALDGPWGWFGSVVRPATVGGGPAAAIDDDLAYTAPWGFDVADVVAPTLLLHGALDRIAPVGHARWLAARIPGAELRVRPDAGHLAVMEQAGSALAWLVERAG